MDTKAQDLKLSLPVMCTPHRPESAYWQIRKRSFSAHISMQIQMSRKQKFTLCNVVFLPDIWEGCEASICEGERRRGRKLRWDFFHYSGWEENRWLTTHEAAITVNHSEAGHRTWQGKIQITLLSAVRTVFCLSWTQTPACDPTTNVLISLTVSHSVETHNNYFMS